MEAILSKLGAILLAPILALSAFFAPVHKAELPPPTDPAPSYGSITNSFVGGKTYFLAGSGISSTATSISLTSFKLPVSNRTITISDFAGGIGYGTIEPGNASKQEFISFTGITQNADGTATLTGVSRGLAPVTPYTASTTYAQSHSGGSIFILSDTPGLYQKIIDYVDATAIAGAPDASTLVKGLGELATTAEVAASTATGGSGPLVIPASAATSTYNSATAANRVVVTDTGGKIDNNFLQIATTTRAGSFSIWEVGKQLQIFSTPGTTTFSVPSGITRVAVQVVGGGGGGGGTSTGGAGTGGGGGGCAFEMVDVSGTSTIQVFVGSGGSGVSNSSGTAGTWSTFGTNGSYVYATGGAGGISSNTDAAGVAGGVGVGGDINLSGGGGGWGVPATNPVGGAGGSSCLGGGASGTYSSSGADTGQSASTFGGGGGGGAANSGNVAGGSGAGGAVILRW